MGQISIQHREEDAASGRWLLPILVMSGFPLRPIHATRWTPESLDLDQTSQVHSELDRWSW